MIKLQHIIWAIILMVRPDDYLQYGVKNDYQALSTFFYRLQQVAHQHLKGDRSKKNDGLACLSCWGEIPRIMQAFEREYLAFNVYGSFPVSDA